MDTEQEFIEQEVEETEEEQVEEVETEVEESQDEEPQVEAPKPEAKKRAETQIDRLKRELKEAKAKLNRENNPSEDALLARLENRGVMESEEQEYVIKFARAEGISPIEALSDEVVKDKLAFFKKQREVKASTYVAPNRTGGKVDEVDKWVARYRKDGSLPDGNPALISKILDKLKG